MKISSLPQTPGIYLVKCGAFHKIGMASNLNVRVHSMQSQNPTAVSVVAYLEMPVDWAKVVEAWVLFTYEDFRVDRKNPQSSQFRKSEWLRAGQEHLEGLIDLYRSDPSELLEHAIACHENGIWEPVERVRGLMYRLSGKSEPGCQCARCLPDDVPLTKNTPASFECRRAL